MQEFKIKDIVFSSPIVLAPMAGVTNEAYRILMKKFGCGLVVSEMVSDFALIYNNKETIKMIDIVDEERPTAIQLFGGSKDSLVKGASILLQKSNPEILDINLGCPVPKVVKENAGSSWLKEGREEELFEAIKGICEVARVPVTCKVRLGWDSDSINVVETCKRLEKAGVSAIAIHGRTRAQFYEGVANHEYTKKVKEELSIPVIANGDINSLDKAIEVLEYTKADAIMIGRGALGNPFLITQIATYLKTGERLPNPTMKDQITYCFEHYSLLKKLKGEYKAISEMRGLAPHYFKGFVSAKKYRAILTQMKSEEEFKEILNTISKDFEAEIIL